MPFALFIVGVVLVTVAVRNTQDTFIALVKGDFTGPGNFFWWVAALVIIGVIGNVDKLKPLSDGLLILILIALILARGNPSNAGGGVFQQFVNALKGTNSTTGGTPVVNLSGSVTA